MQLAATLPARLRLLGRAVVDGVLPPRCLACGATVGEVDALCGMLGGDDLFRGAALRGVRRALPASAGRGGDLRRLRPPPAELGPGARGDALRRPQPPTGADAEAWRPDAPCRCPRPLDAPRRQRGSRRGRYDVAGAAAWTRLFSRRYNQAALLAHAIRTAGGPPVAADWLVRRRRTPSQGLLGPAARARNVRGAFAIRRGRSVTGKRVVLVDDVLTTGATAEECARVLRRAGAASVGVLVLARALRTGS